MFDPAGLSRVELEHVLARSLALGLDDDADAIVTELAGRTWQHHNPYAEWPDDPARNGPPEATRADLTAVGGFRGPRARE